MCKGLAVVAEKINGKWWVYAKEGIVSHDELLHELREELRDGATPHIKFEVYFPMIINDDIQQDVARNGGYYPVGWIETKFGKWVACPDSVSAVAQYLTENKILLDFTPQMLHNASLDGASLNGASLNGASLNRASLNDASLDGASLDGASLNRASLNGASLNGASLKRSDLIKFWAQIKVSIFDRLYINLELKTREECEKIVRGASP